MILADIFDFGPLSMTKGGGGWGEGGTDYAISFTTCQSPPDFETFLRPWYTTQVLRLASQDGVKVFLK